MFGLTPAAFPAAMPTFVMALQFLGLASVILMRCSECGRISHAWFQRIFLMALVTVGLTTAYCLNCGDLSWIFCGTTFSAMAVGATLDLQPARH